MRPIVPLGILGLLIAAATAAAHVMGGGSEQAPGQGYQWVGLHHAAIRVPASWTSDPDSCPTGQDQPAQVEFTQRCGTGNAYGDRVVVQGSPDGGPIRLDFNADPDPVEKLEVGVVEVLHMGLGCQRGGDYAHTCFDALYVPSEDAYFILQSEDHGSRAINRLIHGLTFLPQSLGLD